MSCINIKNPEYIKLQNELDVDDATLELVISDWFEQNPATDQIFPEVNQIFDMILDKKFNSKDDSFKEEMNNYSDLFNFNSKELFMENLLDEIREYQKVYPNDRIINLRNVLLLYKKYESLIGKPILINAMDDYPRSAGLFRLNDFSITINLEQLKKVNNSKESLLNNITNVLIHELTHALTENAYASNIDFKNKIDSTYSHSKNYLEKKGLNDYYGLMDVHEFMAEATSNTIFQDILKTIPYKSSNVFNIFFNYIIELLGLDSNNVLTEALNLIDDAIKTTFKSDIENGNIMLKTKRLSLYQSISEFNKTLTNEESKTLNKLTLNNKVIKNCK